MSNTGDSTGERNRAGGPAALAALSPRRHWRRFAAALVALFVVRGVLLACVMPPFEGWDEYQHLAYVRRMHNAGRPPVFDEAVLGWRYIDVVVRYPLPNAAVAHLRNHSAFTYHEYWSPTRPDLPHGRNNDMALYEAQHPSLYYRLAAPLYAAAGELRDPSVTVSVLRLGNVLLGGAALAVFLDWAGRAFADAADAAVVGLWAALHPIYLLNVDRVANDALAVLLGTIVVVWAMRMGKRVIPAMVADDGPRGPGAYARPAALGLLLGCAVMAKTINLALVPFVLACVAWPALRAPGRRSRRVGAGIVAAVVLATAVPTTSYFWFNLRRYGMLVPMAEAVANRQHGRGGWADVRRWLTPSVWLSEWWALWVSRALWVGGWSFLKTKVLNFVYQVFLVLALSGWLLAWPGRPGGREFLRFGRPVFRDAADPARIVLLCACVTAALSYHALQSMIFYDGASSTYAWYTAVALPFFLAMAAAGALRWRTRWLRVPLALAVPVTYLAAEARGIVAKMIPTYADEPLGADALRRLATLHPRGLGTTTLLAASATAAVLAVACVVTTLAVQLRARAAVPRGFGDAPGATSPSFPSPGLRRAQSSRAPGEGGGEGDFERQTGARSRVSPVPSPLEGEG